jgi:hypothetical protein
MLHLCDDIPIIEQMIGFSISNSASPGFIFGRGGNASSNTWLINNEVPSNITGIPFGLNNGKLLEVWVASENVDTYDIEVYWHLGDEISLTLLTTVNVVAQRQDFFGVLDFGLINVPTEVQLGAKITGGSAKNPKVALFVGGS